MSSYSLRMHPQSCTCSNAVALIEQEIRDLRIDYAYLCAHGADEPDEQQARVLLNAADAIHRLSKRLQGLVRVEVRMPGTN